MAGTENPDEPPRAEPGQIDPFLQEGPTHTWAIWALGVAIVVAVGIVFYALMTPSTNSPAPSASQSAATSQPPRPAATSGSGSGQTGQ